MSWARGGNNGRQTGVWNDTLVIGWAKCDGLSGKDLFV
jgi:hypothetical protein